MKLVEILARELNEWPEGWEYVTQDVDGETSAFSDSGFSYRKGYWSGEGQYITGSIRSLTTATDHATAIVTREMWEAERLSQSPGITMHAAMPEASESTKVAYHPGGLIQYYNAPAASLEPDWSKAPEGATHWGPRTGAYYEAWYKISDSGVPLCYVGDNEGWTQTGNFGMRPGLSPRPTTPQWTGEGLPPVGTVCEMHHNTWPKNKWEEVIVKYCSDSYSIVARDDREESFRTGGVSFRPIDQRTPREKWIEAAERTLEENTSLIASSFQLGILFDAGLAKLPEDGE